jgi:hypothetical protein
MAFVSVSSLPSHLLFPDVTVYGILSANLCIKHNEFHIKHTIEIYLLSEIKSENLCKTTSSFLPGKSDILMKS